MSLIGSRERQLLSECRNRSSRLPAARQGQRDSASVPLKSNHLASTEAPGSSPSFTWHQGRLRGARRPCDSRHGLHESFAVQSSSVVPVMIAGAGGFGAVHERGWILGRRDSCTWPNHPMPLDFGEERNGWNDHRAPAQRAVGRRWVHLSCSLERASEPRAIRHCPPQVPSKSATRRRPGPHLESGPCR